MRTVEIVSWLEFLVGTSVLLLPMLLSSTSPRTGLIEDLCVRVVQAPVIPEGVKTSEILGTFFLALELE